MRPQPTDKSDFAKFNEKMENDSDWDPDSPAHLEELLDTKLEDADATDLLPVDGGYGHIGAISKCTYHLPRLHCILMRLLAEFLILYQYTIKIELSSI
jgi:hypothetical protein